MRKYTIYDIKQMTDEAYEEFCESTKSKMFEFSGDEIESEEDAQIVEAAERGDFGPTCIVSQYFSNMDDLNNYPSIAALYPDDMAAYENEMSGELSDMYLEELYAEEEEEEEDEEEDYEGDGWNDPGEYTEEDDYISYCPNGQEPGKEKYMLIPFEAQFDDDLLYEYEPIAFNKHGIPTEFISIDGAIAIPAEMPPKPGVKADYYKVIFGSFEETIKEDERLNE